MAESDTKLGAAEERGRKFFETAVLAASARYDGRSKRIVIELTNGSTFAVPASLIEGLAEATEAERRDIEVWGDGYAIRWDKLDLDFTVPGLVSGIFGTRKYMAQLAGRSTSEAKAAAARANGKKGGRPRKAAATSAKPAPAVSASPRPSARDRARAAKGPRGT